MTRPIGGIAAVTLAVIAVHAQTALPVPVVDVNGPHIILNNGAEREWRGARIELNGYWEFTVGPMPKVRSLCINAVAFVPLARVRAGGNYAGIHYEPDTMNVKTATLTLAGGRTVSMRVTKGTIKPLTQKEAIMCVGAAPR